MGMYHCKRAVEERLPGTGRRYSQYAAGHRQRQHRRQEKEVWLSLGITLCVILANEVDGLEWRTLIDGNREAPVLTSVAGDTVIDPMKLVWSKVKAGEPCNLAEVYRNLLS